MCSLTIASVSPICSVASDWGVSLCKNNDRLSYHDMVALWDHRVRPHHHGWVLGSPPNGLDMFVQCFIQKRWFLGQVTGTCKVGLPQTGKRSFSLDLDFQGLNLGTFPDGEVSLSHGDRLRPREEVNLQRPITDGPGPVVSEQPYLVSQLNFFLSSYFYLSFFYW